MAQDVAKQAEEVMTIELTKVAVIDLLESEANFIALYDVVLGKIKDNEAKKQLTEFRGDHEEHVKELERVLRSEFQATFKATPTPMAETLGKEIEAAKDDKEVIGKFCVNEDFARRTYLSASMLEAPEKIARVIQRCLDDEEKHYAFACSYLAIEPVPL